MRLADGQKLDDERLSGFDFDGDFFAGFQTIKKCGRGQNADVRIGLSKLVVLRKNVGIKQIAQQVVAADGMAEFFHEGFLLFFEFHRLQACTWAAAEGSLAPQNYFLQLFRQPPGGTPRTPENISTTELGNETSCFSSSLRMSAGCISLAIRKRVMSPTTLLDGVTFTMSPKSWFTSAYIFSASRQR